MEFRLLGGFEVWSGDEPVEIAGSKQRALLALLALRANEVVRSELLIDELWGEHPPRNAAASLHTHVSRLRKALGSDTIASRKWGYVLRADPADIDLRRFEGLLSEAEPLAAQQRAAKLAEALALWRGPPLADLVNEPALQRDIARLEELRLRTVERRIDAELEAGNADVVGELEELVAQQPLREHLRWLLILALYRADRQAEALEVYRETRRVLTEELGLEPSPALKDLEQAILRQDPSLNAKASPTQTELPAEESDERKRRRVPPVALLALLALGLAGTATAIALIRPEKGTSSGTQTEAIFETLTATTAGLGTDTVQTTDAHRTTTAKNQNPPPQARPSSDATTTTRTRTATTAAHGRSKKSGKVGPPPKLVTITDNFSESTLDPLIWSSGNSGPGASFALANGQLVFSIAGDATLDPKYHWAGSAITTRCELRGNFDARIHFKLQQWPPANGATIALTAQAGTTVEAAQRFTATWGDGYSGWPNGRWVSFPVQSGSLRLTRSNGVVQGLYRNGNAWVDIPAGAVVFRGSLQITVGMSVNQATWQQQDVSAAVDTLKFTAQNADCPAGSKP